MNKALFLSDIENEDIKSSFYVNLIEYFTKFIKDLVKSGITNFYTRGDNGFSKIIFFIVEKMKKEHTNLKNIIIKSKLENVSDVWYNKMYELCDCIDENLSLCNFDGIIVSCYNTLCDIEKINKQIIWREKMEIKKIDNLEKFDAKLLTSIRETVKNNDKDKFDELVRYMGDKFNEHGHRFVEFGDSKLDEYLQDKKIIFIDDKEVHFDDDKNTVVIKVK